MHGLHKNQTLYCQNGETVTIVACVDNVLFLLYKGRVYKRSIDSVGSTLFTETPCARVGDRVVILDVESGKQFTYLIVPSYHNRTPKRMGGAYYGVSYNERLTSDAIPDEGTISDQSPLGKAIIGHPKGDLVTSTSPAGKATTYQLIDIYKKQEEPT